MMKKTNDFEIDVAKMLIDPIPFISLSSESENYSEDKEQVLKAIGAPNIPDYNTASITAIMNAISAYNKMLIDAIVKYHKDPLNDKLIQDVIDVIKSTIANKLPQFFKLACARLVVNSIATSIIKKLHITSMNPANAKKVVDAINSFPKPLNIHVPIDKKLLNCVASIRTVIRHTVSALDIAATQIPSSDAKRASLKAQFSRFSADLTKAADEIRKTENGLYTLPEQFIFFMNGIGAHKPIAYYTGL